MNAIWYVHWIDLRRRVLFIGLGTGLLVSMFLNPRIQENMNRLHATGRLPGFFGANTAALNLSPEVMVVLANVMDTVWVILLMAPIVLAFGTGLSAEGRASTRPFILTLPVSRTRAIQTRFLANCAAFFILTLAAAALAGASLEWQQFPVPWEAVWFTTVVGSLLRIPILAAAEAANGMIIPGWGAAIASAVLLIPYFAAHLWLSRVVLQALADPGMIKQALLLSTMLSIALVWLADYIEREKEY